LQQQPLPPRPVSSIPRIDEFCNYTVFLKSLLKEKHNRKVFLWSEKEVVDQCFRLQATQQFKLENDKLKRAIAEVNIDLTIVRPR
jgi:hypothetical protein